MFWINTPAIHIGIEGKESIGVIERAEELTADLIDSFGIEFEVLPRAGVGEHVPTNGIGAIGVDGSERIDSVAQTFGHLIAVLIQHESVGDDVFVCHSAINHGVDGVEGKEPSACLVYSFRDEIGGTRGVAVLKRIVILGIRHRAGVEPHINQIELALHGFAGRRDEYDGVNIRTMEVDDRRIVVSLAVIARFMVRPRVCFHETGLDGFVYFYKEFGNRTDANLFGSIFGTPDRKRSSPVTRAGEVPVVEVIEPLAETSGTGGFRLPVNGLVEGDHLITRFGRLDEP